MDFDKTKSGIKVFKSSMGDTQWGTPGFSYTQRADYQHKIYEFAIPFEEIGLTPNAKKSIPIQLAFAAYGTCAPAEGGMKPDIAYNSIANEFMLVYHEGESEIFAQRLNASGNTIGNAIELSSDLDIGLYDNNTYGPKISYNPKQNQFLAVWTDNRNSLSTGTDIYGRVLNSNGGIVSNEIQISDSAGDQRNPSVAFDSSNDRYLVVWEDEDGNQDTDVFGQLLNSNGSFFGDTIETEVSDDQILPAVAYDSTNNRFLVVWVNSGGGNGISGQLISASGSLYGTEATEDGNISIEADDAYPPSIAFDSSNDQFLVSFSEDRYEGNENDIFSQLVDVDGTLINTDRLSNVDVQIDEYIAHKNTTTTFNPTSGRYMAVWKSTDATGDSKIEGKYLASADASPDVLVTIKNLDASSDDYPVAVANPYCNNFIITWDTINNIDCTEYHELFTSVTSNCAPDPGLLWPNKTVTPTSDGVGASVAYKVIYTSASNTAPIVKQLHIDLNGNNNYEDLEIFPIIDFPKGPPPSTFYLLIPILAIVVFLLIIRQLNIRMPVLNRVSFALLVGVIVFTVIISCSTTEDDENKETATTGNKGFTVTPTSGLVTTESGGTASFEAQLDVTPDADVAIAIQSDDSTEGTTDVSSLTFTATDWNTAQTVTITGVDDASVDGSQQYQIEATDISSDDTEYSGLSFPIVTVTNTDNDSPVIDDEIIDMTVDTSASASLRDGDYTNGEQYITNLAISEEGDYKFKFVFSDGITNAVGDPTRERIVNITIP